MPIQVTENSSVLGGEVMVITTDSRPRKAPGAKPTSPVADDRYTSLNIAYWGDGNDFPQKVIEKVNKNSILPNALEFSAKMLVGRGLQCFRVVGYNDDGSELLEVANVPEINEFMKRSNIQRWANEAAVNLVYFRNPFSEIILSKNRQRIVHITEQDAAFCRWKKMDDNGKIPGCIISSYWPQNKPTYQTEVPTLDPYDPYRFEELRNGSSYKYIYPSSYPSPGKSYYQLAPWNGALESGWYEIAQSIPQWKKAYMENKLNISWVIKIDQEYWKKEFENWEEKTIPEKKELMKGKLADMEERLMGAKNAGKAMGVPMIWESIGNSPSHREWIKIEPIKVELGDGKFLEDSVEASTHLLFGLGIDGTLIGNTPGKQLGSGSGSDKRVAFNIYQEIAYPLREMLVEPLNFITAYNGWGDDIRWKLIGQRIVTLDNNRETGKQE